MHDQAQKIAGLLHPVGAVGDHDGIHIRLRQQLIHALGALEPHFVVHVLAADIHDLLATDVGQVAQPGHGLDQILDSKGAGLVASILARHLGAGDRAAGGEDHHLRLRGRRGSRKASRSAQPRAGSSLLSSRSPSPVVDHRRLAALLVRRRRWRLLDHPAAPEGPVETHDREQLVALGLHEQ